MRMNPNQFVQKRGEELDAKRFISVGPGGLYDTRNSSMVSGSAAPETELAKYQSQRDALKSAMDGAKNRGEPATYISGLQDKLDETNDKISLLSKGKPNSSMVERSTKTLTGLLAKRDAGEPLTHQDYIDAIGAQGAIESNTHAVVDPNTGTVTYVQNTVPNEYSVQTLFGKGARPSQQPTGGISTNPVPGQVTQSQAGNAKVTTIQGQGARPAEAEVKVLSEGDALKGQLVDIGTLFRPQWTGPIAGRVGAFKQSSTGNASEPGRADFIAKSQVYYDRTVKFITGAQMSEVETKRLIKEIPNPNDPPDVFQAKLKSAQSIIDYTVKAYQQNMRQGGVRVIGGNTVSPNQAAQPYGNQGPIVKPYTGTSGQSNLNPPVNVMTATNPQTGERVQSLDGGKSWQPMQ